MNFDIRKIGVAVGVAVLCFLGGRFSAPVKVETKEVEKVVTREQTQFDRTVDRKEIVKPDGTKIVETHSSTERSTDSSLNKESSKQSSTELRPNWHLNVTYQPALVTYQDQIITIDLQRRLFGEIYLGLAVSTQKTVGVSLGIGF